MTKCQSIKKAHLEFKNNNIMYNIQWKLVDKVYGNAYSLCKL